VSVSGSHRQHPRPTAGRISAARSLAGVAVVLALLGGGIYVLVIGTDLEDWTVLWVSWTALLVKAIAQRRHDRGYILLAAGLAVSATWQVISAFAHHYHWPASQLSVIAVTGDWLRWAVIALVAVSVVIGLRSGTLTWPPWRSADQGPADPG
jgi:hypothetical protein